MQTSDAIALAALFVAIIAALYARWAARASERSNEITLHNERLKIYRGLLDFRAVLVARGPGFPDDALWSFSDHVLLSEFYFSEKAHQSMKKLLDDAFEVKTKFEIWNSEKEAGSVKAPLLAKEMHGLHRAVRARCEKVAEILRPSLLLEKTRKSGLV